jgi:peptide/nickel transport system substrate-binding protein
MKLSNRFGAAVAVAALVAASFAGSLPAHAAKQTTLTFGAMIEVKSWDPTQADLGHMAPIYQAAYDNLITRTPSGKYVPNLATKWTWSGGGSMLTLKLRKGVKFSDGATFTAQVAKANLDAFIGGNGPYSSTLAGANVQVIDANTIRITLGSANPDLLYYLATTDSYMASPNAIGTAGLKTKPVGSGPYIYDSSSVVGSSIVFTANPKYWDKKKIKFQKVVFKTISDVTARLNALLSGQIDATLLDVKTAATAKDRGFKQYSNNVDWAGFMILDRDGKLNKDLKDARVRQAIAMSVDRAALLKAVQNGYGTVTQEPFGKPSGAYDSKLEKSYSVDNAKAKSLLAAAGYPNGLTVSLPAWPDPTMRALLSDQLGKSGITLDWASVPAAEYRNVLKAGKWPMAVYQLGLAQQTAWASINMLAAPNASWNVFKSTDPVIAGALESINKNQSDKNVAAQAKVINKFLIEQAWFIPFYQLPQLYFTNSHVKTANSVANAIPYLYNFAPTGK